MPMTIGSVPYLNARPLVDWFYDTEEGRASGVTVVEAVPSVLDRMLRAGELDCALLSSVTQFRNPSWRHAPGAAITSFGPVTSVRLFSRVPIEEITSVALDTSSLTSVALVKILLKERFGRTPTFLPHPPDLKTMLADADAALLIGDNGFREYDAGLYVLDLGEAWTQWTSLPFVYALWLGPANRLSQELVSLLRRAKEWGTSHVPQIAELRAATHGKTVDSAIRYMTESIRYNLGEQEEAGLALFADKARLNDVI